MTYSTVVPPFVKDCDITVSDDVWRDCLFNRVRVMCVKAAVAGDSPAIHRAMIERLDELAAAKTFGRETLCAALVARRLQGHKIPSSWLRQ